MAVEGPRLESSVVAGINVPLANLQRQPTALSAFTDPEKGPLEASKLLDGFPKIAAWSSVTGNNDKASDIFKIFHRSSTRNLLYLQSRVAALQEKQTRFDREDYKYRLKESDTDVKDGDADLINLYYRPSEENLHQLRERLKTLVPLSVELHKYAQSANNPSSSTQGKAKAEHGHPTAVSIPNELAAISSLNTDQEINQYAKIHAALESLEYDLKNSTPKLPSLPQDLFWGPVTDRGPRIASGVPEDYILHTNCVYKQPRSLQILPDYFYDIPETAGISEASSRADDVCKCFSAFRQNLKTCEIILASKNVPNIMQMLQQRIRVLEDYLEQHLMNWKPAHENLEKLRRRRAPPSLAITLAARSWEDFEIFGRSEKMWERRRTWDEYGSGNPWPFDMSDVWIGKMRERWEVAQALKTALNEYYDALAHQHKMQDFERPIARTVDNAAECINSRLGHGSPQFLNSSQGLLDNQKDLVVLNHDVNEQPVLLRLLSNAFANSDLLRPWFWAKKLSTDDGVVISESKIGLAVTITVLVLIMVFLLIAVWVLKLIGDEVAKSPDLETFSKLTNIQLGALTVFTIVFSVLILFLGGSRFEIVASTAAYAAVLVIFMAPVPIGLYNNA